MNENQKQFLSLLNTPAMSTDVIKTWIIVTGFVVVFGMYFYVRYNTYDRPGEILVMQNSLAQQKDLLKQKEAEILDLETRLRYCNATKGK